MTRQCFDGAALLRARNHEIAMTLYTVHSSYASTGPRYFERGNKYHEWRRTMAG